MRKRPHDFFEEHIRGIYIRDRKIGRGSGYRQAFVKITGRSYTSRTVFASLRYIGKESDGVGKDTRVIDESGKEIKPADFEKAVKEWGFNPEIDRRNESKGTRERKTRLTTQFVVSFPKSCSLSVKQTEDFMDAFMLPYREKGAKYFIAVHTEQGCKHAHVIVRNKTEFGERLTFDRKDIQALRQRQVEIAKSYGIRLENTLSDEAAPVPPLNGRNFRLTQKDREKVLKSRDEIAARMTSPLAYPRIGIEAAWRKIHNLTAEHKHPRQTKEREREIEI